MLTYLAVKNIAVIEKVSLEFEKGLNIITGEISIKDSEISLSLFTGAAFPLINALFLPFSSVSLDIISSSSISYC